MCHCCLEGVLPLPNAPVLITFALFAALSLGRNGSWRDEFALFTDAAGKSPLKARPYNVLSKAYLDAGDTDAAVRELTKAASLPSSSSAFDEAAVMSRFSLARAYALKGMHGKALEEFSAALALYPIGPAYFHALEKMYGSAVVKRIKNLYSDIYLKVGLTYYKTGDARREAEAYIMSISMNPDNVAAYNNLGAAYVALGRREDAVITFRKALQIDPADDTARRNLTALGKARR